MLDSSVVPGVPVDDTGNTRLGADGCGAGRREDKALDTRVLGSCVEKVQYEFDGRRDDDVRIGVEGHI